MENSYLGERKADVLDVEDDEARQRRIQIALENLNKSSATTMKPPTFSPFNFGKTDSYEFSPPTELISRVQAFLPQLEASNAILAKKVQEDPKSVDIENLSEGEARYIEMNLGLGIFEQRSGQGEMDVDDAEMSSFSSSSASTASSSTTSSASASDAATSSDSEVDCDSDASSEIITCFVPSRPIRPLPKRSRPRPHIVVLGD